MTSFEEGKQLRAEVAKLRPDKRRRYSADLRKRILDWVDRCMAEDVLEPDCSKTLCIKTWRFRTWRRSIGHEPPPKELRDSLALVPIEMPPVGIVLVTPAGYRVAGLTVLDAAALLRELA